MIDENQENLDLLEGLQRDMGIVQQNTKEEIVKQSEMLNKQVEHTDKALENVEKAADQIDSAEKH